MFLAIVFILAGIALLAFSADRAVEAAEQISEHLGISPVVIGALVVGLGTSLPEMVVSGLASAQRDTIDLAIGNIVGSNAANLTLVLGTGALILPLTGQRATLRREGSLMLAAAALFSLFIIDDHLARWEGAVLLLAMIVAAVAIATGPTSEPEVGHESEPDTQRDDGESDQPIPSQDRLRTVFLWTLLGLVGVVVGAQLLVTGATTVAESLGASEAFIGLTVVAIGTSIPELATTVASARRGSVSLIIGNVLGSNVFNSLAVGGVAGLVGTGVISEPVMASAAVMMVISVLVLGLGLVRGGITRRWAGILFAAYVLVLALGL